MPDSRGGLPLASVTVRVAAVKPMRERDVKRRRTRKCVCYFICLDRFGSWIVKKLKIAS